MKIIWLQAFVSVAKHNSFSVAAEELFMSQSSVSKYVLLLEDELGVALFSRTTRSIALTSDGERVLVHAKRILEDYQLLCEDLDGKVSVEIPTINIMTVPVAHLCNPADIIEKFRKLDSQHNYELTESDMNGVIQFLEDSTGTIGIVRSCALRFLPKHIKWRVFHLFDDELMLLCNREHPLATKQSVSLEDCIGESIIALNSAFDEYKLAFEECGFSSLEFRPSISLRARAMVFKNVELNNGISILTRRAIDASLKSNTIVVRQFIERPRFPLMMVCQDISIATDAADILRGVFAANETTNTQA